MNIRNMLTAKRTNALPEPPQAGPSPVNLNAPASKVDGRAARTTGRGVQFNTKVRPDFLERFDKMMTAESERLGRSLSRPYFLELMLAVWSRAKGGDVAPFGLSEPALKGAEMIAEKTGWPLAQVIEDAIAARVKELGVAGTKTRSGK